MAGVNKAFLLGNLTRDPELRYTANGLAVAGFGLAINRKYKQNNEWKEEVCFVDITVWGKQAENCAEYLNKGNSVFVEGRLNYRSWETEQGQKRNKLEIVASNVQFLSRPAKNINAEEKEQSHNLEQQNNAPPLEEDVPF
jgi:single-strand DNA-binding protein